MVKGFFSVGANVAKRLDNSHLKKISISYPEKRKLKIILTQKLSNI